MHDSHLCTFASHMHLRCNQCTVPFVLGTLGRGHETKHTGTKVLRALMHLYHLCTCTSDMSFALNCSLFFVRSTKNNSQYATSASDASSLQWILCALCVAHWALDKARNSVQRTKGKEHCKKDAITFVFYP